VKGRTFPFGLRRKKEGSGKGIQISLVRELLAEPGGKGERTKREAVIQSGEKGKRATFDTLRGGVEHRRRRETKTPLLRVSECNNQDGQSDLQVCRGGPKNDERDESLWLFGKSEHGEMRGHHRGRLSNFKTAAKN